MFEDQNGRSGILQLNTATLWWLKYDRVFVIHGNIYNILDFFKSRQMINRAFSISSQYHSVDSSLLTLQRIVLLWFHQNILNKENNAQTESCRVQLNIVDTVMQRTESLSLSPLIMWPDQCILGWRERGGLMMKERVHKPHPLQIQMSFSLQLYFYRTNMQFCPFGTGFVTHTIWERNGTKLWLFSYCGTTFWAPFVHEPEAFPTSASEKEAWIKHQQPGAPDAQTLLF